MARKILSFVVALGAWQACIAVAFAILSFIDGLKVEDVRAFIPYALFSVPLAGACVVIGARLTILRATITGLGIGLLPSAILATLGALALKGIEARLDLCLATASAVGGGLAGLFSSYIQRAKPAVEGQ